MELRFLIEKMIIIIIMIMKDSKKLTKSKSGNLAGKSREIVKNSTTKIKPSFLIFTVKKTSN